MLIGIQDEILRLAQLGLLEPLLKDQTTGHCIRWATDEHAELGAPYACNHEITPDLIIGERANVIRNRARKALELQSDRTKSHAEVFTPIWVCNRMIDEIWHEDEENPPKKKQKNAIIKSRFLEITCGEAPFLVQRYDVLTGEIIPIEQRKGILDRKLHDIIAHEKSGKKSNPLNSIKSAFKSVYGYELQGDSLLIARLNLYMTFEEYLEYICHRKPTHKESLQIIEIITWNIWQMDGLTGHTPCAEDPPSPQRNLFDLMGISNKPKEMPKPCQIRFYIKSSETQTFTMPQLSEQGEQTMKFDYIIGNPPYQEEAPGTSTSDKPIYHLFMDETYKIGKVVELITPGRFLFRAGATPSEWNARMLADPHLKVVHYEQNSSKMFPNTDIKGGVSITYHAKDKQFGSIDVFTLFHELNSILHKVGKVDSICKIIYNQNKFDLDKLYEKDKLYEMTIGSNGKDKRFRNNIFEKIKEFTEQAISSKDIKVLGVINSKRVWRYLNNEFIDQSHENLY
ncbi:MAG: Eco57I restriction-modification methylase domain-containing protein, partial [Proteobacteria bacterium]|nr:Eco57I restriction-modification methylase domain-containing protein [Pseudomonadota bacterium]